MNFTPWRSLLRGIVSLVALLPLGLSSLVLRADDPAADRVFAETLRLFEGGWYDRADKGFAEFLAGFPHSTNRAQVLLLQAQSRFKLRSYDGVVALLQDQWKSAGDWADQYLFWMAEAKAQQEQFEAAARIYAQLLQGFPASRLRLEASYEEAFAQFRMGNAAQTVDLLKSPAGAFQQAAKGSTNQTLLVRGVFLLAEALFARRDFRTAEQRLKDLAELTPEAEWERQYLLTRIELADGRTTDASARVTNLVTIANLRSNAVLQARSLSLKGEILEIREPDAAVQAYEALTKIQGATPEQNRQALLKLVDLAVAQNRFADAVAKLEAYIKQDQFEPTADLFRMTLGEIYLKQFYSETGRTNISAAGSSTDPSLSTSTNVLRAALAQFDQVINQFTNSPSLGKAFLDRGWCFWEESLLLGEPARLLDSRSAFEAAAARLPKSFDQATALFKLGDCCFRLKDYTNALANYHSLLNVYSDLAEVKQKLLDNVLYQIVRASLESNNLPGAEQAVEILLRNFPKSSWSDQALLLYSQGLLQGREWLRAREGLATFETQFPASPLLPDARLLLAKLFANQSSWPEAIQKYQLWLDLYTNHLSRPQAAFDQAWCYAQAGADGNALQRFTNLVQQFPGSSYASLARLWTADFYLNQRDYERAEINFQLLINSTNSTASEFGKEAQIMAAKTAVFREDYDKARSFLTNLVDDPKVGSESWFMLGDIELEKPTRDSPKKLEKFEQAILRFQRVVSDSTNRLVPLAMAKIANCHFQLASQDPARYDMATNQYWQVVLHPLTDPLTRSQAEFGLGQVLEKMSEQRTNQVDLLHQALDHYLAVVYQLEKEAEPDPYWLSQSALAAGSLASDRFQRFDEAERLYEKMRIALPALSPIWDKKLQSLREQRLKYPKTSS